MKLLLPALLTAFQAFAASSPQQALLVLSKGNHTLSVVDPSTLKVVATMPTGEDPHEVIASTDGAFAYVSNYGGGAYNTIAKLDLRDGKAVDSFDLGALRGPHGLAFMNGKVWFTAEAAKAIGHCDPTSSTVDWVQGTGQDRTHMIALSKDLSHIYTTNISSATVSIFEKKPTPAGRRGWTSPDGDWEQTVVPVGKGAEGFDVTPDEKALWTANAKDGTVSIIDLASKKVTDILQANVRGANRLKFTPDGKHVFISSLSGAGVAVINAATHRELKRIPAPNGAAGIQMEPDGKRAFVAFTGDDYVAVIDTKTLEVIGKLDAGPKPDGMAWMKR